MDVRFPLRGDYLRVRCWGGWISFAWRFVVGRLLGWAQLIAVLFIPRFPFGFRGAVWGFRGRGWAVNLHLFGRIHDGAWCGECDLWSRLLGVTTGGGVSVGLCVNFADIAATWVLDSRSRLSSGLSYLICDGVV